MNGRLHIQLLGGARIWLADVPLHPSLSRKAHALLLYLVLNDRPRPRSHLAGLLWPDVPETNARANLRKELAHLRRELPDYLIANRQTLAFNRKAGYWLDVEEFQQGAAAHANIDALADAVALYHGDFLSDFCVQHAPTFDEWVLVQRAHLREQVLDVLNRLAAQYSKLEDYETSISYVRQILALEPWREEAHRQLMKLLAKSGQRGAALAQYETLCAVLAEELDVDPAPETIDVYDRIRSGTLTSDQDGTELGALSPGDFIEKPPFLDADAGEIANVPLFVGREGVLSQLEALLDAAVDSRGQIIFVAGEAGSGKTALLREFARRALERSSDLIVAGGTCNAYGGIGDPYLPWREIMSMLTGDVDDRWQAGAISREHALRLWNLLPEMVQMLEVRAPELIDTLVDGGKLMERIAAYVSAKDGTTRHAEALLKRGSTRIGESAADQNHIFEQYTELLANLASGRPLLLWLDDLQWADPTSISLFFYLARHVALGDLRSPILLVGAYRPEDLVPGVSPQYGKRHPLEEMLYELRGQGVTAIDLNRASISEGRSFVDALLDTEPNLMDESFREALHRHTQGNALFTTELIRDLRDRQHLLRNMAGQWVVASELNWSALPAQVEGVIARRLARLDRTTRDALAVASVEGEEFTAEVVARVLGFDARAFVRQLSGELDRRHHLVSAQGVRRLGTQRVSRYRFGHNLFQRYLYFGLDEVQRLAFHEDVGDALEAIYSEHVNEFPAQLARHYRIAGLAEKASDYLLRAGRRAVRIGAYQEALGHLRQGLDQLKMLPESPTRDSTELRTQLNLAISLQTTEGWPADEVGKTYARADDLAVALNDDVQRFRVLWGLQHFHVVRGELGEAQAIGEAHLALAERLERSAQLVAGHFMVAGPMTMSGDFLAARDHWEQGIKFYDRQEHAGLAHQLGSDPGVFCRAWGAHALWSLGLTEQAMVWGREALSLSEELNHPFSQVVALAYLSMLHQLRCEPKDARRRAQEAMAICSEKHFAYYRAWAQILRGWALAEDGSHDAGITEMRSGLAALLDTGGRLREPHYLILVADALGKSGHVEAGLATLAQAQQSMLRNGEWWRESELYRLRAELLAMLNAPPSEVEALFGRAIDVARRQRAKSLELRAARSLAELWAREGKRSEARGLLTTIYSWFDECDDTPELRAARLQLDRLA